MGVFSKVHRYREAGQDANVNNVERFGTPARSLFTSTKVFTLHHRITITDENEVPVYTAQTKFPSLMVMSTWVKIQNFHIVSSCNSKRRKFKPT